MHAALLGRGSVGSGPPASAAARRGAGRRDDEVLGRGRPGRHAGLVRGRRARGVRDGARQRSIMTPDTIPGPAAARRVEPALPSRGARIRRRQAREPVWHRRAARAHARHLRPAPRLAPGARRPAPPRSRSRPCWARSTDVDRLVLLGDVVELVEGRATPGDGDRRAGPARDRRARWGATARSSLVPGNHDAPFVRSWLRATGGPAGLDAPGPAPSDAAARPRRDRVARRRRARARALPRRLARPTGSGRPTATTSTATCCPSRATASRAGCSAACRATARPRPSTSAPARPVAHALWRRSSRRTPRPLGDRGTTSPRSCAPRRCRASAGGCCADGSRR